jgi:hypothetical protein
VTYELVSGELERRLGMFEQAQARFERLKLLDAFNTGVFPDIVELQLKLATARNPKPQQVPRKDRPPVRRVEL